MRLVLPVCLAVSVVLGRGPRPLPETWRVSSRPTLVIGAADGDGPEVFGSIVGVVRLASGVVVVADGMAGEIRVFDPDGHFGRRLGRRGDGPGEFRTIQALRKCAADSVVVYDPAHLRLSVFAPPDAGLVRTIDLSAALEGGPPPYEFYCGSQGVAAYVHRSATPPPAPGPRRPTVAITIGHPSGARVSLGRFPASERYFDGSNDFPRPFGKQTAVAIGSDLVYVGTGDYVGSSDSVEVQAYSRSGRRAGTFRIRQPRRRLTGRHIARYVDEQIAQRTGRVDTKALAAFYRALEYPSDFPAVARLLVDAQDNLWVEQYPVPGAERRVWTVYSRAGGPISTVTTPAAFQLTEAGTDYVLGIWRDESGAEFVRSYALLKSRG